MKRVLRVAGAMLVVAVVGGLGFLRYPLWVNDQILRFHLWRSGVESKYVVVGSERLHYFEAGPPDGSAGNGSAGKPLLLVHGLGARGEDWGGLLPGLAAAGFHVYAPDLPGYGRSTRPNASYSIAMEEEAVAGFMRAVHLERADVGGWSMGGWIALKLTLDHPELVERLVVYDSAGLYFPASEDADLFTPADTAGVRRLMGVLSPRAVNVPEFAARAVVRKIDANRWVIQRSMTAMMGGRELLDFRLHRLAKPVLVVWGSRDELIPLAVGERMHAGIAGSSMVVVEGCGHLAPAECWRPVLDATVEFLRAQPAMVGGKRVVAERAAP